VTPSAHVFEGLKEAQSRHHVKVRLGHSFISWDTFPQVPPHLRRLLGYPAYDSPLAQHPSGFSITLPSAASYEIPSA
jgi:hypothetical protein